MLMQISISPAQALMVRIYEFGKNIERDTPQVWSRGGGQVSLVRA